jgi:hypothetical protein
MSNKTLAQFMSEVREYLPEIAGESYEEYRQRLYEIAHPLFTRYMDGIQAKWHREQARQARQLVIDAKVEAWHLASLGPIYKPLTVQQELSHSKQTKLRKAKERYTR